MTASMMACVLTVLPLAALAFSTPTSPSARTTVNFDFAWRFSRGFEPRSAQCTYEQNTNYG